MGPTWALSAPDGPHVGPMNLAIKADVSGAREQMLAGWCIEGTMIELLDMEIPSSHEHTGIMDIPDL